MFEVPPLIVRPFLARVRAEAFRFFTSTVQVELGGGLGRVAVSEEPLNVTTCPLTPAPRV
jgi:hypothetical protein